MNDKFTLRDFFAFFLSGIAVLIFITLSNYQFVVGKLHEEKEKIKDFSTLIIFFSIPSAYFLGQILHGIDSIFYIIATKSRRLNILRKWYNPGYWFLYLLNRHRISGKLFLENKNLEGFWQDCANIQAVGKFSACEYWYVMNDLFKGLYLGTLIFTGISIITHAWSLAAIYSMLTIVFWFRAIFFADNFADTVRRTKCSIDKP